MKAKVLMSVIATIALLMPSTAMAANHKHRHEAKPKPRIEHRMHVAHHPAVGKRFSHHRPTVGTRFAHRPVHGKFIMVNRERMWVADGVIYRMIPKRTGTVYIVAGFLR